MTYCLLLPWDWIIEFHVRYEFVFVKLTFLFDSITYYSSDFTLWMPGKHIFQILSFYFGDLFIGMSSIGIRSGMASWVFAQMPGGPFGFEMTNFVLNWYFYLIKILKDLFIFHLSGNYYQARPLLTGIMRFINFCVWFDFH